MTIGVPDWSRYVPESSQPPIKALAALGMVPQNLWPLPIGTSQIGATERMWGRSSPPSLCSGIGPEISGPQNDVSSRSLDHVYAAIIPKPLLKRRSILTCRASYWFLPHGLEFLVMPPRILIGRNKSPTERKFAVASAPVTPGNPWNGLGIWSSHAKAWPAALSPPASNGLPLASKRGVCRLCHRSNGW